MSGYSSVAEVKQVIRGTLKSNGLDPKQYNIAGIFRDAFYDRGYYGYGARDEQAWDTAVINHRRKG